MPSYNEQEYEQRRQQIMRGAMRVFAEKGFDRASNRDIADAAAIGSPGLIYHYFEDKEHLLQQVLLEHVPLIRLIDQAGSLLQYPPEEALPRLALRLAEALSDEATIATMKIMFVEAIRSPRVAQAINTIGPGRTLGILATYMEQQMAAGRLRPMNPQIAARLFAGPLIVYMLTRYIFEQPEAQAIAPAEMASATADSFLRQMQP